MKEVEHLPLLQERFSAWVEKVEFWQVNDGPEALAVVELEVMDLAARLIGGGGRRTTLPPRSCGAVASGRRCAVSCLVKLCREGAGLGYFNSM